MKKYGLWIAAALVTLILALAFRLPELEARPMHGDEANQAYRAGKLLDTGEYRYDPAEHHGPTLYYFALLSARITGADSFAQTSVFTYRIVPVVFGIALVLITLLLTGGLGRWEAVTAALFAAISPAMVYYSRYFIQETLLVFFAATAIAAGWRYSRSQHPTWAILCGAALGLMHATKETTIIFLFAMSVALMVAAIWRKWERRNGDTSPGDWLLAKRLLVHGTLAVIAVIVVSMLFYSSFFRNPSGIWHSLAAYAGYFFRATTDTQAQLHAHPWYYYLSLLAYTRRPFGPWWSEAGVLALGVVGMWSCFRPAPEQNRHLVRFLTVYTLVLLAVFSVIPYKTPWNALGFLHGFILLAGVGVGNLMRWAKPWAAKVVVAAIVAAVACHLGLQMYRAIHVYPADPRNPYVYAHTSSAFTRLTDRIDVLSEISPPGRAMRILVIATGGDYWPIPFYLRGYKNTGFYARMPEDLTAPVIIVSRDLAEPAQERLLAHYHSEMHALRPGVFLVVFIEDSLWREYLEEH